MSTQEANTKSRIIGAVKSILDEGCSPKELTVRQIAERANVGIGTINYHFQSKDRLVYEAVNSMLANMANNLSFNGQLVGKSPQERLTYFLMNSSDLLITYYDIYMLQIRYELIQGDMNTSAYLLPLLKEIFGSKKHELEIKIVAIQIISALQVIFLNPESFKKYSGIDIFNKEQRDMSINILLNNIINQ